MAEEYVLPGYNPQSDSRVYKSVARARSKKNVVDTEHVECLADIVITSTVPNHEYHPDRWFPWVPGLRLRAEVVRIRPNIAEGEATTLPGNIRELKYDDSPLKVIIDYHFCDGINNQNIDEMVGLVQLGLFKDGFGDFEEKLVGTKLEDIPITCDFTTIMPEKDGEDLPIAFCTINNASNIPSAGYDGFVLEDGSIARGNGYEAFGLLATPISREVVVPGIGAIRQETTQNTIKQERVAEVASVDFEAPVFEDEIEDEIESVELPDVEEPRFEPEPESEDAISDSLLNKIIVNANLARDKAASEEEFTVPSVEALAGGSAELDESDVPDELFSSMDEEIKKNDEIAAAARREYAQETIGSKSYEYEDITEDVPDDDAYMDIG